MSAAVGSIGFSLTSGLGLNNQKLAVLGLLTRASDERRPVVLPHLALFDPRQTEQTSVQFAQVFDPVLIGRFARRFGIEIVKGEPSVDVEGWPCFTHGAWLASREVPRGLAAIDDYVCQFFNHLVPRIVETASFQTITQSVFSRMRVRTVIQLRIEKDWVAHSRNTFDVGDQDVEAGEDYLPSFDTIVTKVCNTPDVPSDVAYVACDEANLPVSKDAIRDEVMSRHGLRLIWKSDVLDPAHLASMTILDRSLLDFEMAVRAPYFVGLSRSTFSDLATLERLCRTRRNVETHYIYNAPGNVLGRRMDNGSQVLPRMVVNRLLRREALIPPTADDFRWSATLTAHISNFGDLASDSGSMIGSRGNPLVCGVRGSTPERIEGFVLTLAATAPVGVEYRALTDDGSWTSWVPSGEFVGTRGQYRRLRGFSIRTVGEKALSVDCVCIGSFVGQPELVIADSGEACRGIEGAELEAMQIVFRPMYHKWVDMFVEPLAETWAASSDDDESTSIAAPVLEPEWVS